MSESSKFIFLAVWIIVGAIVMSIINGKGKPFEVFANNMSTTLLSAIELVLLVYSVTWNFNHNPNILWGILTCVGMMIAIKFDSISKQMTHFLCVIHNNSIKIK